MIAQDLFWAFLFNVIINSFLGFFTLVLLVHLTLFVFRIKNFRVRAWLFSLPLIKCVLDCFKYDFNLWAFAHQINPLSAETGSRTLSVAISLPFFNDSQMASFTGIQFYLSDGHTFTLADLAAFAIGPFGTKMIVSVVFAGAFLSIAVWSRRLMQAIRTTKTIKRQSSPCLRSLTNVRLISKIRKMKIQIRISSHLSSPCAFGLMQKYICIPKVLLENLTQEEWEAVLAHEINHLIWHDSATRLLTGFIAAFFWWLPTRRLLGQLKWMQEFSCDDQMGKFALSKIDLASALVKAAKFSVHSNKVPVLNYFFEPYSTIRRLKFLTENSESSIRRWFNWLQLSIACLVAITLILGRFWTF